MKLLQKILRRIAAEIREKPLSEKQITERTIQAIISGGGKVGDNVDIILSNIDLLSPYLISIGNNVTLTMMRLLTHDASTKKFLGFTKFGRVTIGDNVFVGAGSIILPGTTIGNNVIVGAGSVVASDIPDNSVAVGQPCRKVCKLDDYLRRMSGLMAEYPVFDFKPGIMRQQEHDDDRVLLSDAGYGFMR